GRGPHRRHRVAAHLHLPVAALHRVPARQGVRPAHPRGGAAGASRQGGHPDHGRDHHLHVDRHPVPAAHRPRPACDRRLRRRARLRPPGLRRRLHEARQAALARAPGPLEADRHRRHLHRPVADRDPLGAAARHPAPALHRRPGRPRIPVPRLHLRRPGRDDVGGEPHRRPRRPRRRLRGDRDARLHRHHLQHRPARPHAGDRLPGRRLRRLPVVQLVSGVDLHGRHRIARPRRRHRRSRGDDQDRDAAHRARRDLRDRGALGDDPGLRLPVLRQARLPDGADPSPLRAAGLVGDQDHPALLDRRLRLQRDRLHPLPAVAELL
ncbi:MAG: Phospho-N-acetylmuramoyl-pentapeptide-transferase, partial [uncultured Solirubrobacteraceae bacterium]